MILYDLLLTMLLLFKSCFNEVIAQDDGNIKLTDLNFDVLRIIFDQLDFPKLINASATNSKLNTIAEAAFRHKYRDYEIRIVSASEEFVDVPYSGWIENVFKYAGKWVGKIMIQDQKSRQISKIVNEIVNKYTFETLIELDLRFIKNDTFEQFKVPFNAVEVLTFLVGEKRFNADMQPLNQIFPKLRRFEFILRIG